jgi:hypothetical protein
LQTIARAVQVTTVSERRPAFAVQIDMTKQ